MLGVVLSFFAVIATFGQDSHSVVADEFQNPNCEDMWAHLDNFAIQILNNSEAIATTEISGKVGDLRNNLYWEAMIRSYFNQREISAERNRIVRTPLTDKRFVRFWLTPPGAALPSANAEEWSMNYSSGTKPFIFTYHDSWAAENTICLNVDELALLARVMAANPGARVNVVLYTRSDREYLRRKTKVIQELNDDYDIPTRRIRMFKKILPKPDPRRIQPNAEYWLLL